MKSFVLLLLALLFVFVLSAGAQTHCVAVRGIAQEHLLDFGSADWQGGVPGFPWVGPVQLSLGQTDVVIGKVSEYDGEPGPSNHTGQGRDTGTFVFDFGPEVGSFTLRYTHAVWPTSPKFVAAFSGTFHAQGTVDPNAGTGRFAGATGNLTTDGPFMAWNLSADVPSGRFNNTITGTLCLAPQQ